MQLTIDGTQGAIVTYDGLVRAGRPAATVRVASFSAASGDRTGAALDAVQPNSKVQFNADGTRLLTVFEAEARVWDTSNGHADPTALDGQENVLDAAFSLDGRRCLR